MYHSAGGAASASEERAGCQARPRDEASSSGTADDAPFNAGMLSCMNEAREHGDRGQRSPRPQAYESPMHIRAHETREDDYDCHA